MNQWNPNDYHQSSSQQEKWAKGLVSTLALKGHERVLDIGCGDGKITAEVIVRPCWTGYFAGFQIPWGFYGPEDYRSWLEEAGLVATRLELIPKDMTQQGCQGLEGWLRTTWMPYWQRLPEDLQQPFLAEIVETYVRRHPLDAKGLVHVPMVRLQVEATTGT